MHVYSTFSLESLIHGHLHYFHILAAGDNTLINKKWQSSQKAYFKYGDKYLL